MSIARSPRKPAVFVVLICIALGLWAVLLNVWLNLSSLTGNPWLYSLGRAVSADSFVLSVLVVWGFLMGLLALVNRFWLTLGISLLAAGGLATINSAKIDFRGDPLQPSDWSYVKQTGFLVDMVGVLPAILGALAVAVIIIGSVLLGRLVAHRYVPPLRADLGPRGRRWLIGGRIVVALTACALLASCLTFHRAHNPVRVAYQSVGVHWKPWNQRSNYIRNGFVGGMLFNLGVDAMRPPQGYSREAMTALAKRYAELARQDNAGRTGSLDDTNVVFVLSESFSQPQWLKSITWPEDPIPNTTALMRRTLSGKMLTPGFGGQTANIEFELLTGQTMSFFSPQVQIAYDQVVPKHPGWPSFVKEFEQEGHRAEAMHPFNFSLYRRKQVLPELGFQQLISRGQMRHKDRNERSLFISDKSAYEEVVQRIGESSKPVMVHLITMQNHLPYRDDAYADPILPTSGLAPKFAAKAGSYARGLRYTDAALPGFLDALKKQHEKTVVVFYGDHLPGQVYPVTLGQQESPRARHETPWFMWSNSMTLAPHPMPTISPNQFVPVLLDAMNVPLTPYQALLDRVRGQVPGMDAGMLIGADNKVLKPSQLTVGQRALLHDYRMAQYDLGVGKRYAEKSLMKVPE